LKKFQKNQTVLSDDLMEAVDKAGDFPQRKGKVCAGNPRRVSCAIEIKYYQNFYKF